VALKFRPTVVERFQRRPFVVHDPESETQAMKLSTTNVHGISVVSIQGSLDFYTSPSLRRTVSALLADGSEHIVFDLSDVQHLDRSGIAVLVGTAKQQAYVKRQVSLVGVDGRVRTALERGDADLPTFGAVEELHRFAA
jgi:anti-anti-sigma factor